MELKKDSGWGFKKVPKEMPAELAREIGKVFTNAAENMLKEIQKSVPVRTGAFLKSLKTKSKCEQGKDGKWTIYSMVGVDKNMTSEDEHNNLIVPYNYYHLLEFGFTQRDEMWHKPMTNFGTVKDKYFKLVSEEMGKIKEKLK